MRISDWSSDVCSSDLLLALALQALVGASTAQARPAPESFADLVEGLLPAVVNIQTQQSIEGGQAEQFEEFFKEFFERRGQGGEPPPAPCRGSSPGPGFIIDPTGYIAPNPHLLRPEKRRVEEQGCN